MHSLLVALLNKEAFGKYGGLTRGQLKTDETKEVYRALEILHEQTEADLTLEGLALGLHTVYPAKKAEVLGEIVRTWNPVDPALVNAFFQDATQKARAYEIATRAVKCFEGELSYADFQDFISSDHVESTPEFEFVSHNLSNLMVRQEAKGGFKWRLQALNQLLGHIPRQTFGFIFSRPDTGKTALLASEITSFLLQTDDNVLWVANEEDPDIIKTRCFQALYGVTTAKLYAKADQYQENYNSRVGKRLMISGDTNLSTKSGLERAIKAYNPAIVVVDQLDKLRGFKSERDDLRLGQTYAWLRSMAIKYNFAAIGVTQANTSAEGKKWLRMTDIADGHTAKPAEADWILGIGKIHDESKENERYLHTCKDKLPLSPGKDAARRHGTATVWFNPENGRYQDYGG